MVRTGWIRVDQAALEISGPICVLDFPQKCEIAIFKKLYEIIM